MLIRSSIQLIKYCFSVSAEEQNPRFLARIHDPLQRWTLNPMDLESRRRWDDYTKARETVLERSHTADAPWWIIQADDNNKTRLDCIHHLLSLILYGDISRPSLILPERLFNPDYLRNPAPPEMYVPEVY
jgi:polyphosphate kinase 2 (PPK2 family)